jgi:hypothetical protein
VPPFPLQGLPGFPDRISSIERVPIGAKRGVGTGNKKMTTPKCRHFPLQGLPGFPECISPL